MGKLEIKIKTLTPLWTGGVDTTMDRIHGTGLLGSLRWWYEAVVRGLGGYACDPTSDNRCPDESGNYCDVCQVFGATGLRRAFRLEGPVWWNEERSRRLEIKVNNNRGWYLGRGFMGQGDLRLRTLRLPEGWSEKDLWQILLLTLRLISCWGGVGQRTQQGYGVARISHDLTLDVDCAIEAIQRLRRCQRRRAKGQPSGSPSLDGFFFAKIRFPLNDPKGRLENQTTHLNPNDEIEWYLQQNEAKLPVVPLASVVRYHLRQLIRDNIQHNNRPNAPARWKLMGVVNGLWHATDFGKIEEIDNEWYCYKCRQEWNHFPSKEEHGNCKGKPLRKAKCANCNREWHSFRGAQRDPNTQKVERRGPLIRVSHAYLVNDGLWEFRIWGWIPETLPGGVSRATVFHHLRRWLDMTGEERQWHSASINSATLWSGDRLNLTGVQVCWFGKQKYERSQNYLRALLGGCDLCRNSSSHRGETP